MRKLNRALNILLSGVVLLALTVFARPPMQVAAQSIILSPTSGSAGQLVFVTGSGFTADASTTVYMFMQTTFLQSALVDASSNFTTSFVVPSALAADNVYPVSVYGGAGASATFGTGGTLRASASFSVTSSRSITISPTTLFLGGTGTITGQGFTGYLSTNVYIFAQQTQVATALVSTAGTFSASFTVPAGLTFGSSIPVTVWTTNVYGSGTQLASASFTLTANPQIIINPVTGSPGGTMTVNGTGFAPNSAITFTFDDVTVANATSNASGGFTGTFPIPETTGGSHSVRARDASANTIAATFTTQQSVTISPTSGFAGTPVTIGGKGFSASRNISITYKGIPVTTSPSTITASSNGSFSASFVIPSGGSGAFPINVSDGTYTSTAQFTTQLTMTADKATGPVGTEVNLTGQGFQPNSTVNITFDGKPASPPTSPTNASGSFTYKLVVPATPAGAHTIAVSDASGTSKTASFTLASTINFSATSGYGGSKVTATATGLNASAKVTITFGTTTVTTATDAADASGNFSKEFTVPALGKGTYKMELSDGVNKKSADFSILTSADINKIAGNIGIEVTASGTGFSGEVTVKYDGNTVATTKAAAGGDFSVIFKVPPSVGGPHTIIIADSINTVTKTFTVEKESPPAPAPALPPNAEKAKAEAIFDWPDVSDPSGVTYTLQIATDSDFKNIVLEKKGLATSEYTVAKTEKLESRKKETPYYWRVKSIDGASNESAWSPARTFYVSGGLFNIELPVWVKYLLLSLGALLIGFIGFLLGRRSVYSY
ncbi:MAG: hypothetical protein HYX79_10060 [Chloroflexi bacterium]|nr:hypothetical protein [Chloroflexota bacterium]